MILVEYTVQPENELLVKLVLTQEDIEKLAKNWPSLLLPGLTMSGEIYRLYQVSIALNGDDLIGEREIIVNENN